MICNVDRETNGQQVRIANGLGYMGRGGDAEQLNRRGGEGAEWGGEWGGDVTGVEMGEAMRDALVLVMVVVVVCGWIERITIIVMHI